MLHVLSTVHPCNDATTQTVFMQLHCQDSTCAWFSKHYFDNI